MRRLRNLWWTLYELWDSNNRWVPSHWLCGLGLHWHIVWDEAATPGSYDPPLPPEPGFICAYCATERLLWRDRFYWLPKERLLRRMGATR